MDAHQALESIAKEMVTTGLYKDEGAAVRALAVDQIERKIATYQRQVETFEKQYGCDLDSHSRALEGQACMEEEDEWMDWKGAVVMLEAWQKALQEVLTSAPSNSH